MSWYKDKGAKKRRPSITLSGEDSFGWEGVSNIEDSYNVVTVKIANKIHNFYLWSGKTVESAKSLYDNKDYIQSLKMLKKYSFDISSCEEDSDGPVSG